MNGLFAGVRGVEIDPGPDSEGLKSALDAETVAGALEVTGAEPVENIASTSALPGAACFGRSAGRPDKSGSEGARAATEAAPAAGRAGTGGRAAEAEGSTETEAEVARVAGAPPKIASASLLAAETPTLGVEPGRSSLRAALREAVTTTGAFGRKALPSGGREEGAERKSGPEDLSSSRDDESVLRSLKPSMTATNPSFAMKCAAGKS